MFAPAWQLRLGAKHSSSFQTEDQCKAVCTSARLPYSYLLMVCNNQGKLQESPHLVRGYLMHKGDLLLALESWHLHRKQMITVELVLLLLRNRATRCPKKQQHNLRQEGSSYTHAGMHQQHVRQAA